MRKLSRGFLLLLMWIGVVGCTAPTPDPRVSFDTPMGYVQFEVDIVRSTEEMARGLAGVEYLPANRGMVFWFTEEDMRFFWMKDVLIPLDIIFLNEAQEVVHIEHNLAPCLPEGDCPSYSSMEPSQYVVEINGGLAEQYGIGPGSQMELHF